MQTEKIIKTKLIGMSKLISKKLEEVGKEKMDCHPSLVRLKELERQKWIAKAETMVEVIEMLSNELQINLEDEN